MWGVRRPNISLLDFAERGMTLSYKGEFPLSVVSVGLSAAERGLLEGAAMGARTSLSDFVRRSALEAAELALMGRNNVAIPPEGWADFEAFATVPARKIPALAKLAVSRSTWEE